MTKFLTGAYLIWLSVRESLLSWAVLLTILLILLLVCRCFTSPVKLARKKLKTIHDKVSALLPSRKNRKELEEDVPPQKIKEISKEAVACQRLMLAYYYDHGEDMRMKDTLIIMKKIYKGMEAAKSDQIRDDRKALGSILRNIESQCEAALAALEDY